MRATVESIEGNQCLIAATRADSEDCALGICTALIGCAVEISIAGQNEPGGRDSSFSEIKGVQSCKHAVGGDLENRAVEGKSRNGIPFGDSVQIAIRSLDECAGGSAAVSAIGEGIDRSQSPCGSDSKHVSIPAHSATRHPIKIPVPGLHERTIRSIAIVPIDERVKDGECAVRQHSKDRAEIVPSLPGGAIEIPITGLD